MSRIAVTYRGMPGGLNAFRGSRVVGEIHRPILGGSGDYWFRSLVSPGRGRTATLAEAKHGLEQELRRFFDATEKAAETLAAARAVRPAAMARPWVRNRETCPRCACDVIDLSEHLVSCFPSPTNAFVSPPTKHGTGQRDASVPSSAKPASVRVTCPECGVLVNEGNLSKHRRKVHGQQALPEGKAAVKQNRQPAPAKSQTKVKLPGLPPGWVRCPDCKSMVAVGQLDEHRRRHRRVPAAEPAPDKYREIRCSECGLWVMSLDMAAHRSRYHPSAPKGKPSPSSSSVKGPGSETRTAQAKPSALTKCPDCGKEVQKRKLAVHRAQHAKVIGRRQPSATKPRAEAKQEPKRSRGGKLAQPVDRPFDPVKEHKEDRRLDASRDYGHAYRERGRFGSHAAYDDYGEESGA